MVIGAGSQLILPGRAFAAELPQRRIKAHYLIDIDTQEVFAEQNIDTPIHPASITKMFLAAAYYKLTDQGLIDPTESMQSDLERSLVISSNRSARELGEDITRSPALRESIQAAGVLPATQWALTTVVMPEIFSGLGLTNTQMWNTSGLPGRRSTATGNQYTNTPDNVSTAREIITVAKNMILTHPEVLEITKQAKIGSSRNTNRLLPEFDVRSGEQDFRTEGVLGLKTGYISASRFNHVYFAERHGKRLLGVEIGAETSNQRFENCQKRIEDAFALIALRQERDTLQMSSSGGEQPQPITTQDPVGTEQTFTRLDENGREVTVTRRVVSRCLVKPEGAEGLPSGDLPWCEPRT